MQLVVITVIVMANDNSQTFNAPVAGSNFGNAPGSSLGADMNFVNAPGSSLGTGINFGNDPNQSQNTALHAYRHNCSCDNCHEHRSNIAIEEILDDDVLPVGGNNPALLPVGGITPASTPAGGNNPALLPVGGITPASTPAGDKGRLPGSSATSVYYPVGESYNPRGGASEYCMGKDSNNREKPPTPPPSSPGGKGRLPGGSATSIYCPVGGHHTASPGTASAYFPVVNGAGTNAPVGGGAGKKPKKANFKPKS